MFVFYSVNSYIYSHASLHISNPLWKFIERPLEEKHRQVQSLTRISLQMVPVSTERQCCSHCTWWLKRIIISALFTIQINIKKPSALNTYIIWPNRKLNPGWLCNISMPDHIAIFILLCSWQQQKQQQNSNLKATEGRSDLTKHQSAAYVLHAVLCNGAGRKEINLIKHETNDWFHEAQIHANDFTSITSRWCNTVQCSAAEHQLWQC